jgi:hypothetical protein
MLAFERLELVQEAVEFLVGNFRSVVDVIPLFVMPNQITEGFQALFDRFGRHGSPDGGSYRSRVKT